MLSKKPWQPEVVLMFFGALFASFCFVNVIALLLRAAHISGFKNLDDFGFFVLGTLGIQGVVWVLGFIFLRLHKIGLCEALGLKNPNWKKSLLLAPCALLLSLPVILLLQKISIALLTKLGFQVEDQEAVQMFLALKSVWAKIYFGLFAVVIAPVAEELVFRGILFPFIKQLRLTGLVRFFRRRHLFGLAWFARRYAVPIFAWLGVSFLFALIHHDAATFASLFTLALVFTWLYEKTNCLIASMFAHSLFNGANLVLLFVAEKYSVKLHP